VWRLLPVVAMGIEPGPLPNVSGAAEIRAEFQFDGCFSEIDIVFLFKTINREASAAGPNFPEQLAKEGSAA
jgi:hypothetical protein